MQASINGNTWLEWLDPPIQRPAAGMTSFSGPSVYIAATSTWISVKNSNLSNQALSANTPARGDAMWNTFENPPKGLSVLVVVFKEGNFFLQLGPFGT